MFVLAHTTFAGVEKLVELNINALKANLQDGAGKTRELLAVKDPQDLISFQAAQFQPAAEKAVAYSRHLYEIASTTQAEFNRLAEVQLADANKKLVTMIDTAAKNAPAGSETAVAMLKSAVAAANSTYDSISKATKQAVEIAEANVAAATNAAVKTAGQAATSARAKKAA
jgi:phasin family protein